MKIWYRCKCCDEKIIIVEKLDRGKNWSRHDWDDLNDFVNCLQQQVYKLDGGDVISIDPNEFDDNLIPKHVFNLVPPNDPDFNRFQGNKRMEFKSSPKTNWLRQFILKWVPEKHDQAKKYLKWVEEMTKKGYEEIILAEWTPSEESEFIPPTWGTAHKIFFNFTAIGKGSIIIDPDKSDKFEGNKINRLVFPSATDENEETEEKHNWNIIEGREYKLSCRDRGQLEYKETDEGEGILNIYEHDRDAGSIEIKMKEITKPDPTAEPTDLVIKCQMSLNWRGYGGLVIKNINFEDKEIGVIDFEDEEKLTTFKTLLTENKQLEIKYKKGQTEIETIEDDETMEESYILNIKGSDFTITEDKTTTPEHHVFFEPPKHKPEKKPQKDKLLEDEEKKHTHAFKFSTENWTIGESDKRFEITIAGKNLTFDDKPFNVPNVEKIIISILKEDKSNEGQIEVIREIFDNSSKGILNLVGVNKKTTFKSESEKVYIMEKINDVYFEEKLPQTNQTELKFKLADIYFNAWVPDSVWKSIRLKENMKLKHFNIDETVNYIKLNFNSTVSQASKYIKENKKKNRNFILRDVYFAIKGQEAIITAYGSITHEDEPWQTTEANQTLIFKPLGLENKWNLWVVRIKEMKYNGETIDFIFFQEKEEIDKKIWMTGGDTEYIAIGTIYHSSKQPTQITFDELTKLYQKPKGTFDEFFDLREGGDTKQLRHEITEWEWKGLVGLNSEEAERFKGTDIIKGKLIFDYFPKLKKLKVRAGKITQDGKWVKEIIIKYMPELEELDLNQTENLEILKLGEKRKLKKLDIRWTSIKELNLTKTSILKEDYDTPKLPVRVNGTSGDFIFPFTENKGDRQDITLFYKEKKPTGFFSIDRRKPVFKIFWPKGGERKTLYEWRQVGKINDRDWQTAIHSLTCDANKNNSLLLEEAKELIKNSMWDIEQGELTLKPDKEITEKPAEDSQELGAVEFSPISAFSAVKFGTQDKVINMSVSGDYYPVGAELGTKIKIISTPQFTDNFDNDLKRMKEAKGKNFLIKGTMKYDPNTQTLTIQKVSEFKEIGGEEQKPLSELERNIIRKIKEAFGKEITDDEWRKMSDSDKQNILRM